MTDLGPFAPQTSTDATECKWCGAPLTIREILQSVFHIWRWNHHTGSYSSQEGGHRPPPLAWSKHPAEKRNNWTFTSCHVMKDMFTTRVTSVTLVGNKLSSFLMMNKHKAQVGLNIAWREQQVSDRIWSCFTLLFCFLTLTWFLSAELRAALGVFSSVARWGSVSCSSLLERQSPKILQVSSGFCGNTWFSIRVADGGSRLDNCDKGWNSPGVQVFAAGL